MRQSVAMWLYPYRTPSENVLWFCDHGFSVVSQHGLFFLDTIRNPATRDTWDGTLRETGVRLTVHGVLPSDLIAYRDESRFAEDMALARRWYDRIGALEVLSFDVCLDRHPGAARLVKIALDAFSGTDVKICLEDYGLIPEDREDEAPLLIHNNYAALVDLGHMNVRLTGQYQGHVQLEDHGEGAPLPPGDNSAEAFRNALLRFQPQIAEFHLHNNNGLADQHHLLEDGTVDMPSLVSMLCNTFPDTVCTMEVMPGWADDPAGKANRVAEQEYWHHVNDEFRLCPFLGTPDPARDERFLESAAFLRRLLDAEKKRP